MIPLAILRALPWRYIVVAIALAGAGWYAYAWAYDRGAAAKTDELAPKITRLQVDLTAARDQVAADEHARHEAATEAARLAKQWEDRRDAIQSATETMLAAAGADNRTLRDRLREYAAVPDIHAGSGQAETASSVGGCTLDAARRIVLGPHAKDLARFAADADKASAAASACNSEYESLTR